MSKLVNVNINGKGYKVPEGINLIEAAESVGIHIPNLCYLKGMKGIGACRMCLVESKGRMMTACIMKTKDGMEVVTENDKLRELRKFVIDLILSMHPLDCMTCTKAGVCNLQNYAYNFEIKESTYTRKKFGFPIDEANPFIKRDPDYCILCGRCVRVCKEQGTSVLDFMGRGVGSKVTTADDKPLQESDCTFCGSCVDACPVNALLEADRWRKGREWDYEKTKSICLSCGNACEVDVNIYEGEIAKINAGAEDGRAEHYICAIGRYGYDSLNSDSRVLTPMKKDNGNLKETTWDDVLGIVSEKLKDKDTGIITAGNITNEDALIIKSFVDKAGIANVDTTVSLYGDESSLIGNEVDLEGADIIVLVGLNPSQWERTLPALDAIIRKKVERKTKLIVINSEDTKIAEMTDFSFKDDESLAIKSLAKAVSEKGLKLPEGLDISDASTSEAFEKAAEIFVQSQNPVIISSPQLYEASQNLAIIKGSALSIPLEANAKGIILMGLTNKGKSYSDMIDGGVKVLYVVGDIPLGKRPQVDFLIVQSPYMTDLAKEADIVIPATAFLEKGGSIVDYFGRLRNLNKVVEPAGDAKGHKEIFFDIAKKMGIEIKKPSASDVKRAAKVKVSPSVKPIIKREGFEVDILEMIELINASVINSSRLLWLKELQVPASA